MWGEIGFHCKVLVLDVMWYKMPFEGRLCKVKERYVLKTQNQPLK